VCGLHFSVEVTLGGDLVACGEPQGVTLEQIQSRARGTDNLCHSPHDLQLRVRRTDRPIVARVSSIGSSSVRSSLLLSHTQSVRQVACGVSHSLVLTKANDGALQLYAWGVGHRGQLGLGEAMAVATTMTPITTSADLVGALRTQRDCLHAVRLRCGPLTSCLSITETGSTILWLWGLVPYSTDRHKAFIDQYEPSSEFVSCGFRIVDIALGLAHFVLLSDRGEVFTWGHNGSGQLGIGLQHKLVEGVVGTRPMRVHLQDPRITIGSIACGYDHTLARTTDGSTVFAWGSNRLGACGARTKFYKYPHPVEVADVRNGRERILSISCTAHTSVAIVESSDGRDYRVLLWGCASASTAQLHPIRILTISISDGVPPTVLAGYGEVQWLREHELSHAAKVQQGQDFQRADMPSPLPLATLPSYEPETEHSVDTSRMNHPRTQPPISLVASTSPTVPQHALEFLVDGSQSQHVMGQEQLTRDESDSLGVRMWWSEYGDPFYTTTEGASSLVQIYCQGDSEDAARRTAVHLLQRDVHAFLWAIISSQKMSIRGLYSQLGPMSDSERLASQLRKLGFDTGSAQTETWFSLFSTLQHLVADDERREGLVVSLHALRVFLADPFHAHFWRTYLARWRVSVRRSKPVDDVLADAFPLSNNEPLPWQAFAVGVWRLHEQLHWKMETQDLCRLLYHFDQSGSGQIACQNFVRCLLRAAKASHPLELESLLLRNRGCLARSRLQRPNLETFSTTGAVRKLYKSRSVEQLEMPMTPPDASDNEVARLLHRGNSRLARIRCLPVTRLLRYAVFVCVVDVAMAKRAYPSVFHTVVRASTSERSRRDNSEPSTLSMTAERSRWMRGVSQPSQASPSELQHSVHRAPLIPVSRLIYVVPRASWLNLFCDWKREEKLAPTTPFRRSERA
jgi:alpha-tubulin suppressor-like RCC1 family protein